MVKFPKAGTLAGFGLLALGAYAFIKYGGFSGIGNGIRGLFPSTTQLTNGLGLTKTSAEQVTNTLGTQQYSTNIPSGEQQTFASTRQRELTYGAQQYAGLAQMLGLKNTTIDQQTAVFKNQFTTQPLAFTIGVGGVINTGTAGIGAATLAAQQELSARYGIPTFDVKGNLSAFGGLVSSK